MISKQESALLKDDPLLSCADLKAKTAHLTTVLEAIIHKKFTVPIVPEVVVEENAPENGTLNSQDSTESAAPKVENADNVPGEPAATETHENDKDTNIFVDEDPQEEKMDL